MLVDDAGLGEAQKKLFGAVVSAAMNRSTETLSKMTGARVRVESLRFDLVPIVATAELAGGPDVPAVGVYLSVYGDLVGHVLMLFPESSAYELVDLLCEMPKGTCKSLDSMGKSCLGEVGNITGTSFLIGLSDHTGLMLRPSPPEVVQDMVGAILSTILADLSMVGDEVFVIETRFTAEKASIAGTFLFVPRGDSLHKILSSAELHVDGN